MIIKILIDVKRNLNVFDEFNNFWKFIGNKFIRFVLGKKCFRFKFVGVWIMRYEFIIKFMYKCIKKLVKYLVNFIIF